MTAGFRVGHMTSMYTKFLYLKQILAYINYASKFKLLNAEFVTLYYIRNIVEEEGSNSAS